jgi:RNA-binding protein
MITSKQRSYLRSIGHDLEPIFQIGKAGIAPAMVKQVQEALEARELVKVHVLDNSDFQPKEACDRLARETDAEGVQVVGSKFVLYKKSAENPRIELP